MKRFEDWPTLLDLFLRSCSDKPFSWGRHDCCLFACNAVLAITGEDLAKSFRGSYDSEGSAKTAMAAFGASNIGELAGMIAREYGIEEVSRFHAQRGDVVLVEREEGETLGIVALSGAEVLAPSSRRLEYLDFSTIRRAWRI